MAAFLFDNLVCVKVDDNLDCIKVDSTRGGGRSFNSQPEDVTFIQLPRHLSWGSTDRRTAITRHPMSHAGGRNSGPPFSQINHFLASE